MVGCAWLLACRGVHRSGGSEGVAVTWHRPCARLGVERNVQCL
jgi:hypothetical protein